MILSIIDVKLSEGWLTIRMFRYPLQNYFEDKTDGYSSLSFKQQADFDINHATTTLCHHNE